LEADLKLSHEPVWKLMGWVLRLIALRCHLLARHIENYDEGHHVIYEAVGPTPDPANRAGRQLDL
jgi:hypothetical protein